MRQQVLKTVALVITAFFSAQASATLIGDSVTSERDATGLGGGVFDTQTKVIAPGGTLFNLALHDVFIDASSIELRGKNTTGAFYSGATITDQFSSIFDLDWIGTPGEIVGVSVTQTGDLGLSAGLAFNAATDVTFTADSVQVRIAGFQFSAGSLITVDLITSHRVPEPGTLSLLALGLFGMGLARRRKTVGF